MKIAFVSGGTRGIGRAIAERLHDRGYKVIASGTRPERPADLPAEIDYLGCNIGDSEQRIAAFRYIEETYGRLDVLVNNAGVAPLVREDILRIGGDKTAADLVVSIRAVDKEYPIFIGVDKSAEIRACGACANDDDIIFVFHSDLPSHSFDNSL